MATAHVFPGVFQSFNAIASISMPPTPASRSRSKTPQELRPLDVDMDALELGARDGSDETASWLDLISGEVLVIVKGEPDERMLKDRVKQSRSRYKKVPVFGLAEARDLLREFLGREMAGPSREFLLRLVDEPGAFHACLSSLRADTPLWRAWERHELHGVRTNLLAWMASLGIRPATTLSALVDD